MSCAERSSSDNRAPRAGDNRRLIAAVMGVWALVLQSLLPVAGAIASESGNDFLMEICTTAGLQTAYVDASGDGVDEPLPSKSDAACMVCATCGCTGSGGCGGMSIVSSAPWTWTAWWVEGISKDRLDTLTAFQSRAPPTV